MFRLRRQIRLQGRPLRNKTQRPTRPKRKSKRRRHRRAAVRNSTRAGSRRAALKCQTGVAEWWRSVFFSQSGSTEIPAWSIQLGRSEGEFEPWAGICRLFRQKFNRVIPAIVAVVSVTVFSLARANAQAAPVSLQEQFAAQYKLVKMGSDTGGYSVVRGGHLAGHQKGGILGVPYSDTSILSTKYEGGTVHSPNSMLSKGIGFGMKRFGKKQTTHLFAVGDKVYPSKIEVNVEKDTVSMSIVGLRQMQQDRSADLQQGAGSLPVSQRNPGKGDRGRRRGHDRAASRHQR